MRAIRASLRYCITQALLKVIIAGRRDIFSARYGRDVLNLVHDAREARNKLAHDEAFETDDAFNVLHHLQRLLEAIGAGPQADEVERMKTEQQRTSSQLGEAGEVEALERLQQQEEETFEIVRRRLLGPVLDPRHRDAVIKAFIEF